jgi:hypothetical protein
MWELPLPFWESPFLSRKRNNDCVGCKESLKLSPHVKNFKPSRELRYPSTSFIVKIDGVNLWAFIGALRRHNTQHNEKRNRRQGRRNGCRNHRDNLCLLTVRSCSILLIRAVFFVLKGYGKMKGEIVTFCVRILWKPSVYLWRASRLLGGYVCVSVYISSDAVIC